MRNWSILWGGKIEGPVKKITEMVHLKTATLPRVNRKAAASSRAGSCQLFKWDTTSLSGEMSARTIVANA
ncbi:hypothetical protein CDL15_Pgr006018 [Punica granatum]|uniref:Uncharacterized protein n=1 Tax=Punica granatum TaxID=22663 RepID=A0A218VTP7_PUNGR|nr:hypothetical protein CDL15_Pgr006018 [Punica granatum]